MCVTLAAQTVQVQTAICRACASQAGYTLALELPMLNLMQEV